MKRASIFQILFTRKCRKYVLDAIYFSVEIIFIPIAVFIFFLFALVSAPKESVVAMFFVFVIASFFSIFIIALGAIRSVRIDENIENFNESHNAYWEARKERPEKERELLPLMGDEQLE